ncbi:MAG: hypothetical protein HYU53_03105 [Acidobacteria bacterium]|nr:hypothetical protein [Acidobacteriota bacterium]
MGRFEPNLDRFVGPAAFRHRTDELVPKITHVVPAYVEPAVLPAIALHRTLGAARKAARLRYLTAYWRAQAAAVLPDARFYTSAAPEASVGLCTIEVPGVDADGLQRRLRTRHGVLVQSMAGNARAPEIRGIRVTPNVFTSLRELDRFVVALTACLSSRRTHRICHSRMSASTSSCASSA